MKIVSVVMLTATLLITGCASVDMASKAESEKAKEFKDNIKDTNTRVLSGMDGLIEAATLENADLVVNSVVGMVGLKPTLAAANAKKDIAFANKGVKRLLAAFAPIKKV